MEHKIGWLNKPGYVGRSFNPVTGCDKISSGCKECYAEKMAKRLAGRFGYPADDPFKVTFHPDRLNEPFTWKKPSMVFVISMGDLFHPLVEPLWISCILDRIRRTPQHLYVILTKRPDIALKHMDSLMLEGTLNKPNILLGVTCETQKDADFRIPILQQISAKYKILSVEPMLEAVNLRPYLKTGEIDWVICGAETGQRARPFDPDWAVGLQYQCQIEGVPFFFKSAGKTELGFRNQYLLNCKEFPK